jgi:DNA-binding beta-propeller fold protein YncE
MVSLGALFASACAQDIPGIVPPTDRFYFPVGITFVPGPTLKDDVIIVASSDFDQRFNAGTLMSFYVDDLVGTSTRSLIHLSSASGATVAATLGGKARSIKKIPAFTGELLYVGPTDRGAADVGRGLIFSALRGRNELLAVEVGPDPQGRFGNLDCSAAGGSKSDPAIDCTDIYTRKTGSLDPYAMAFVPTSSVVAIAHLRPEVNPDQTVNTIITLASVPLFQQRISSKNQAIEPILQPPDGSSSRFQFNNIAGATGVAFVPKSATGSFDALYVAQRYATATVPLIFTDFLLQPQPSGLFLTADTRSIPMGTLVAASEMRGVVASEDGRRVYVIVRFPGVVATSPQSGIAVVDTERLVLLSVLQVGSELEHPILVPRKFGPRNAPLIYVPDIREDVIYVIDAANDTLAIAGQITGVIPRIQPTSGHLFQARGISSPGELVYVDHGDQKYIFASNFENSTVAVIDVTDPNPSKQRLVGRIGPAINPDGTPEGPE